MEMIKALLRRSQEGNFAAWSKWFGQVDFLLNSPKHKY